MLWPAPSTRKSWCQIVVTLLITFSIVGVIAWVENEQKADKPQTTSQTPNQTKTDKLNTNNSLDNTLNKTANPEAVENKGKKCEYNFSISTVICLVSDLKLLAQAQNFAVIAAAILFFWDTFDRKKQLERQAWQLIDGAQGSETSGARRQAIEELYQEGSDITGLDADGADLRGINLSRADLTRASFKNAILEEANFEGSTLTEANFTGAILKGANFKKAKLWGANFTRADLSNFSIEKTDLRDADLGFATFNRAKLSEAIFGVIDSEPHLGNKTNLMGAKLRCVNLKDVNLNKVCIAEAKLGGATIEDVDTIRKADKYQEAYYSKDFYDAHNDELKNIDFDYYKDPEFQEMTTKKIVEISQRLLRKESLSLQDEESLSDFVNLLNHLVILVKESSNQCLTDNELFDKVVDVKKALEEKQKTEQDALIKISDNEKLIQETQKILAEKRKNQNIQ
jgi:uncharacterized protein YjbI with pentapeptide repeats